MSTKTTSVYKQFIGIWHEFYHAKTGQTYLYDGQQCKHLKLLIKKIESKVKERGMEPSEENLTNSFKGFLSLIQDQWILDHLDISIVNSKFNSLYAGVTKNSPLGIQQAISEAVRKYGTE